MKCWHSVRIRSVVRERGGGLSGETTVAKQQAGVGSGVQKRRSHVDKQVDTGKREYAEGGDVPEGWGKSVPERLLKNGAGFFLKMHPRVQNPGGPKAVSWLHAEGLTRLE